MNPPPESEPYIGRTFGGQYRVDALLGQGGMGSVYQGTQLSVNRPVAIKLIAGSLPHPPEWVQRFRREAEATARLSHPNSVRLFDFGVTERQELFMVMELLEGQDLARQLAAHGPLPLTAALSIARQVLLALAEAHALQIVHRDIKPENVFLARVHGGEVVAKVMDFGIAVLARGTSSDKLTRTGILIGTPAYMSPEQAQGHELDARSDLYSLGVVLFEMLSGQNPFPAESALQLVLAHATQPPRRLCDVGARIGQQAKVQALLDGLLAKDPAARLSLRRALAAIDAFSPARAGAEALVDGEGRAGSTRASPTQTPMATEAASGERPSTDWIPGRARWRGRFALALGFALSAAGAIWWRSRPPALGRDSAAAVSGKPELSPAAQTEPTSQAPGGDSPAGGFVALPPPEVRPAETSVSAATNSQRAGDSARTSDSRRAADRTPAADSAAARDAATTRVDPQPTAAGVAPRAAGAALAVDPLAGALDDVAEAERREQRAGRNAPADAEPARGRSADPAAEAAPRAQLAARGALAPTDPDDEEPARFHGLRVMGRSLARAVGKVLVPDPPRARREALASRPLRYPSFNAARHAYQHGGIDSTAFQEALWQLRERRRHQIEAERENFARGLITKTQYDARIDRIWAQFWNG